MLGSQKMIAFVPTRDAQKAREFYEGVLGLPVLGEDGFALVLNANGIMLRVVKVPEYKPFPFTILGWEIADIGKTVAELGNKGVRFEHFNLPGQDERGIWTTPGARVAWFKDPDGNLLSVSQHE